MNGLKEKDKVSLLEVLKDLVNRGYRGLGDWANCKDGEGVNRNHHQEVYKDVGILKVRVLGGRRVNEKEDKKIKLFVYLNEEGPWANFNQIWNKRKIKNIGNKETRLNTNEAVVLQRHIVRDILIQEIEKQILLLHLIN